jgi:hypothetical protein
MANNRKKNNRFLNAPPKDRPPFPKPMKIQNKNCYKKKPSEIKTYCEPLFNHGIKTLELCDNTAPTLLF